MGLVVPGVMAYTQLQTKVANIERAQAQEKQDRRENYREIIALLKETRSELRQDIKILRQSINRQRSKQRER